MMTVFQISPGLFVWGIFTFVLWLAPIPSLDGRRPEEGVTRYSASRWLSS